MVEKTGWERMGIDQDCHGTGKIGNLTLHFPDKENTGNLPKTIKTMFLHREFTSNTNQIL